MDFLEAKSSDEIIEASQSPVRLSFLRREKAKIKFQFKKYNLLIFRAFIAS
jgi:hypothetical protein